jgi:hypothetical protein
MSAKGSLSELLLSARNPRMRAAGIGSASGSLMAAHGWISEWLLLIASAFGLLPISLQQYRL